MRERDMPPEPEAIPARVPERPEVSAVVPTLGRSPWLGACLEALRRQQGVRSLEIVVIDQAPRPLALPTGLADRVLRPERNLGFAGGTNLGIAATAGEMVAAVNDDAVVDPGWLAALVDALRADPGAAAVQGINLLAEAPGGDQSRAPGTRFDQPYRPGEDDRFALPDLPEQPCRIIDGCGLGWNRWWQAVQRGHGEPAPPPRTAVEAAAISGSGGAVAAAGLGGLPGTGQTAAAGEVSAWFESRGAAPRTVAAGEVAEVFGVSATAALYRRAALERVALRGGQFFDPRLVSYYEDAELAGRLRAAGFRALLAPAARACHAASTSARAAAASRERWRLIYGNRYLAAARLLGRGLWPRLPMMLLRDVLDVLALAGLRRDPAASGEIARAGDRRERLAGMLAGWGRALRHLPAFLRCGPPVPPAAEVARLSRWPAQPR
jgi:GT2 family glycosyltransferase